MKETRKAKRTRMKSEVRPEVGLKLDDGRLRYDLIHDGAEAEEVAVLSYGVVKYDANNWQHVHDARSRYFAALRRHLKAWRAGQTFDDESSLHHLGHALCCLRFLLGIEIIENPTIETSRSDRFAEALRQARSIRARTDQGRAALVATPKKADKKRVSNNP